MITPARENEIDMRTDEVMDPTTIPGEVSSPEFEKRSQFEYISEDAGIPSQSSSQPKENASISKRKTPSDDLAPRAETEFGAVELGTAVASLCCSLRNSGRAALRRPSNYRIPFLQTGSLISTTQ